MFKQEVRLRKKGERGERPKWPYVHGVRDYRKIITFQGDKGWINRISVCTAKRGNCEPLCLGYMSGKTGRCIFQVEGVRTECVRG